MTLIAGVIVIKITTTINIGFVSSYLWYDCYCCCSSIAYDCLSNMKQRRKKINKMLSVCCRVSNAVESSLQSPAVLSYPVSVLHGFPLTAYTRNSSIYSCVLFSVLCVFFFFVLFSPLYLFVCIWSL